VSWTCGRVNSSVGGGITTRLIFANNQKTLSCTSLIMAFLPVLHISKVTLLTAFHDLVHVCPEASVTFANKGYL